MAIFGYVRVSTVTRCLYPRTLHFGLMKLQGFLFLSTNFLILVASIGLSW